MVSEDRQFVLSAAGHSAFGASHEQGTPKFQKRPICWMMLATGSPGLIAASAWQKSHKIAELNSNPWLRKPRYIGSCGAGACLQSPEFKSLGVAHKWLPPFNRDTGQWFGVLKPRHPRHAKDIPEAVAYLQQKYSILGGVCGGGEALSESTRISLKVRGNWEVLECLPQKYTNDREAGEFQGLRAFLGCLRGGLRNSQEAKIS